MPKEKQPKFSIIIPNWNRLEPLMRAVDSIIKQSYNDWEAIIVDDASNNQTEIIAAISKLNDSRVRIIPLKKNHNASYARNVGIENSSGDWICFLDSDDYFMPNKLDCINNIVSNESFFNTQVITKKTIIYSQLIFRTDKSKRICPNRKINKNEKISDYLFISKCLIGTSSLVMHKSFALKLKFDPACQKHQDYDLLLRAEQAGANFFFIDKPLCVREYRMTNSHVGASYMPSYSCGWYTSRKHLFSKLSGIGFMYTHVFDPMTQRDRKEIFFDILKIIRIKPILYSFFLLIFSTLLPYKWYKFIRDIKYKRG
ncbi:MAG: glycosyltransferase [Methylomicrobium sp.]|nr:glycosyltransferase [Methylomicrobium sp.]